MKRFIALIVVLLLVVTLSTACSEGIRDSKKNQEGQEEVAGSYHIYYTDSDSMYLNFWESFDESRYEIVDISRGDSFWYVTYKDIED